MVRYLTNKDFLSGALFIAAGLICLALSYQFDFGSTARPGPGFFPIVLSVLLICIGMGVALIGLLKSADPVDRFAVRPIIFITLAVCSFAIGIEQFGLVPTVFTATIIASFAKPDFGHVARVVLAACLAGFSALLFVFALGLPISLWAF